ncbi:ecto-ADP-ribosyltransferase 5-like isoform X2 [Phyllobates terribilis]|uniref:ecto-ADP-ribosyltransferase 5-like isoform X2 n=1 Tax=Phyllobates terribilis TaxID=111132 RepID=UPI003CCB67F5
MRPAPLMNQNSCWAIDLSFMTDAFDDQYVGCTRHMEREMPNILDHEKKYKQFAIMWLLAEQTWTRIKPYSIFPRDFKDEYGIAVILYTMEEPFPIYQQLNRNVSIAGRSRDHYMNRFHFKALHYYLTRAIQVLGGGTGCDERSQVYRGSWMTYRDVTPDVRFGHFASSSLNWKIAQRFGTRTQFTIFSCFGVDIEIFSDFKEEEVLIPITEKFTAIKRSDSSYVLRSSGQHCSYYNCAYLGGEKRKDPICSAGAESIKYKHGKFGVKHVAVGTVTLQEAIPDPSDNKDKPRTNPPGYPESSVYSAETTKTVGTRPSS